MQKKPPPHPSARAPGGTGGGGVLRGFGVTWSISGSPNPTGCLGSATLLRMGWTPQPQLPRARHGREWGPPPFLLSPPGAVPSPPRSPPPPRATAWGRTRARGCLSPPHSRRRGAGDVPVSRSRRGPPPPGTPPCSVPRTHPAPRPAAVPPRIAPVPPSPPAAPRSLTVGWSRLRPLRPPRPRPPCAPERGGGAAAGAPGTALHGGPGGPGARGSRGRAGRVRSAAPRRFCAPPTRAVP